MSNISKNKYKNVECVEKYIYLVHFLDAAAGIEKFSVITLIFVGIFNSRTYNTELKPTLL